MTTHWIEEFHRCRPWIQAALEAATAATHSVGDVFALIAKGEAQLHAAENCCIVTVIEQYPALGLKGLSIWLAGGKLDEVHTLFEQVETWGRQIGCTHCYIKGRPGWQRDPVLKAKGYKVEAVILVRELPHVNAVE